MLGKIYTIRCEANEDLVYVGSTCNSLDSMLEIHFYKADVNIDCDLTTYIYLYGKELFYIELIKEYEVVDDKHLEAYEQLYINKYKSLDPKDIYYYLSLYEKKLKQIQHKAAKQREYGRRYYLSNKEKILEKNRQYNKKHLIRGKDSYMKSQRKYAKMHYQKNKNVISAKRKANRKPKIAFTCDLCGYNAATKFLIKRHNKTKKHNKLMALYVV